MENATKALLIAGSVLIAILLIAMGVKILSSTSGTTESTQKVMDATAVNTFNSQFASYAGQQSATNIKALVQKVIVSNANNSKHIVYVYDYHKLNGTSNVNQLSQYISNGVTSGNHKVDLKYGSDGYINYIYIDVEYNSDGTIKSGT